MKTATFLRIAALYAALPATVLCTSQTSQAKPTAKTKVTQGTKTPKKGGAVKHAEEVLGKPLTATQITAVRAAQKQRQKAIKPIQDKFKASVAKALGLTVAQFEAREKALKAKKDR